MTQNKKSIAVILARGGSKRIPNKNIVDFFGKPMVAYTIEACINSKIFDRVIVSTDSVEIAEISKKYGAAVPFLRTEKADDHTPSSEATLFAVKQAEEYYNEKYDIIAQLLASCPTKDVENLKNIYENFIQNDFGAQITCYKFSFMNPWWAFELNDDFSVTRLIKQDINTRSQDFKDLYGPTGTMWLAKSEELFNHKSFYTGNEKYFPIDWKLAVDIDNYEDLELAKAAYLILQGKLK